MYNIKYVVWNQWRKNRVSKASKCHVPSAAASSQNKISCIVNVLMWYYNVNFSYEEFHYGLYSRASGNLITSLTEIKKLFINFFDGGKNIIIIITYILYVIDCIYWFIRFK